MADKKISALTGATTPLAGTEVLPIVQGGATVKVAVTDLTAGRAVSALSLTSATVGAGTSAALSLQSNATTKATLDTSGNFLVNTTSILGGVTNGSIQVKNSGSSAFIAQQEIAAADTLSVWSSATSGDNSFCAFYTEGSPTARGSITYNRAGGLTVYNTTSDYRSKTVNSAIQNALVKIAMLKPSTGRMNGATQDIDFFVAHELQEIIPSAVTGEKDAVNEDNTPKYQMVDKSALIPLLTAAIQEQQVIIESLKTRLDNANL